jgi:hypothetical protein
MILEQTVKELDHVDHFLSSVGTQGALTILTQKFLNKELKMEE